MNKFLSTTIAVLVLGIFTAGFTQDTPTVGQSATWQVQKYDLDVTIPQDASRTAAVKAVLAIKNVSGRPANTLTLRISDKAEVTSMRINEAVVDFSKATEKVNSATNLQRLGTRLQAVPADGVINTVVDYKIKLTENSALGSISPTSAVFLPLSFWYPTPNSWFFTRGADSAPVRIKVNSGSGLTFLSSGSETGGIFEQKLSSQPFLVTGSWETRNENGVAVYVPNGTGAEGHKRAAELAGLFSEARTFMAAVLGKAPDVQLRIVAARRGAGFSTGGTAVVDEAIFRRSKLDSQTVMNVAESAARLWIGNAVSVNGDGYGVISEGLSRYLATQFIESKFGKDVADIERLRQRNAYAAVSKRDAPMAAVSPLDDYYYPAVANKGAMVWRLLGKRIGMTEMGNVLRANMQDGNLNLRELRLAFSAEKELLDYFLDQVTDMNLLIGIPQAAGSESRSALRNTGGVDVTVEVAATTATGERLVASATIKAKDYGEITFRTPSKVTRVEVDAEKLYPQIDYSDDIAPRESTDSDPMLAAKRLFDKQDFAAAEAAARTYLRDYPRFDDLRIILARSLLGQNKIAEAEREFRAVLDEKLPTARSMAWANLGLGEAAFRNNQKDAALRFAEAAISADAEYGASLGARNLRTRIGIPSNVDPAVKSFFADFDKAASSNRKADVDLLVMPGEVTRFAGGVSGSTEQWQTQVRHVDRVDANTVLVEANMNIKLLNKDAETGLAVYRLVKVGNSWKLAGVELFEVR